MIIFIFIIIYLFSTYITYKGMQYSYYHPNGIYYKSKPVKDDIILTFFPALNTLLMLMFLIRG